MKKIKLVAFDLDGTLVKEGSSWAKLHGFFGTIEEEKKNMQLYLQGKIDYPEFMRRDIAAWPKPLHIREIEKILLNYELADECYKVVEELREMDVEIAIISAGIDILANEVAKKLKIKHVIANGLEIDEQGYLTGEGIERVDPLRKHLALIKLTEKLGVNVENTAAVGDSFHDKTFLQYAGIGIALDTDPELIKVADFVVKSIKEIPKIIREVNSL